MTVDPPKADFHLPSRFAADAAESDVIARRHREFILGTAPVSSPPPDDHPAWLGEDTARDVAKFLWPYPSERTQTYQVNIAV